MAVSPLVVMKTAPRIGLGYDMLSAVITNIRSSKSILGTVVFPEQVCLEPFLEGGETVNRCIRHDLASCSAAAGCRRLT